MKIKTTLFCYILLATTISASTVTSLIQQFYEPGWKQSSVLRDGITVSRKPIPGSDIEAVMVSKPVTIQPQTLIGVIEDVAHYHDFSPNSKYLIESRIVSVDSTGIIGYECLSVPLLTDRHYFFRLREVRDSLHPNNARIDWNLVPPTAELMQYLKEHPSKGKDPILLGEGAGSWECQNIGSGKTIASYRLHLALAGNVPDLVVDFGQKVGVIGFFRDVLKETIRRDAAMSADSTKPSVIKN